MQLRKTSIEPLNLQTLLSSMTWKIS